MIPFRIHSVVCVHEDANQNTLIIEYDPAWVANEYSHEEGGRFLWFHEEDFFMHKPERGTVYGSIIQCPGDRQFFKTVEDAVKDAAEQDIWPDAYLHRPS